MPHKWASVDVVLLLQPLSKAHARGKVVAYRVNAACSAYSDEREIPAGNKIELDLPINSSCTVHLDAGTEHGYNDSLHPLSVTIPSHYEGQSEFDIATVSLPQALLVVIWMSNFFTARLSSKFVMKWYALLTTLWDISVRKPAMHCNMHCGYW